MSDRVRMTIEQRVARLEADSTKLGDVTEAFFNVQMDRLAKLEAYVDAQDAYGAARGVVYNDQLKKLSDRVKETRDAITWKPRP